ncbi:MAG: RING finger protein [Holosporaceae bacterium]|nr:RING finger protein [Holosporaceae bacterium]
MMNIKVKRIIFCLIVVIGIIGGTLPNAYSMKQENLGKNSDIPASAPSTAPLPMLIFHEFEPPYPSDDIKVTILGNGHSSGDSRCIYWGKSARFEAQGSRNLMILPPIKICRNEDYTSDEEFKVEFINIKVKINKFISIMRGANVTFTNCELIMPEDSSLEERKHALNVMSSSRVNFSGCKINSLTVSLLDGSSGEFSDCIFNVEELGGQIPCFLASGYAKAQLEKCYFLGGSEEGNSLLFHLYGKTEAFVQGCNFERGRCLILNESKGEFRNSQISKLMIAKESMGTVEDSFIAEARVQFYSLFYARNVTFTSQLYINRCSKAYGDNLIIQVEQPFPSILVEEKSSLELMGPLVLYNNSVGSDIMLRSGSKLYLQEILTSINRPPWIIVCKSLIFHRRNFKHMLPEVSPTETLPTDNFNYLSSAGIFMVNMEGGIEAITGTSEIIISKMMYSNASYIFAQPSKRPPILPLWLIPMSGLRSTLRIDKFGKVYSGSILTEDMDENKKKYTGRCPPITKESLKSDTKNIWLTRIFIGKCPICQGRYKSPCDAVILPCGHTCHMQCAGTTISCLACKGKPRIDRVLLINW